MTNDNRNASQSGETYRRQKIVAVALGSSDTGRTWRVTTLRRDVGGWIWMKMGLKWLSGATVSSGEGERQMLDLGL